MGQVKEAGRTERAKLALPPDIDLQPIPADRTLSDMLEAGDLDGVIGAWAPSCFLRGVPNVARMFPDYPAAKRAYFARTGIFPIMHLISIRRSLAKRHPWLAVNMLKAFLEAKSIAWYELGNIGHLFTNLPWSVPAFEDAKRLMCEDYWSYGLEATRHVLKTFVRYHYTLGLSERLVAPEELFAAPTLDLSKI